MHMIATITSIGLKLSAIAFLFFIVNPSISLDFPNHSPKIPWENSTKRQAARVLPKSDFWKFPKSRANRDAMMAFSAKFQPVWKTSVDTHRP